MHSAVQIFFLLFSKSSKWIYSTTKTAEWEKINKENKRLWAGGKESGSYEKNKNDWKEVEDENGGTCF